MEQTRTYYAAIVAPLISVVSTLPRCHSHPMCLQAYNEGHSQHVQGILPRLH